MSISVYIENEDAMHRLASIFVQHVIYEGKKGCVIFLKGELGAGKTTFARGFLRAMGYQGKVKSPTFTLIEPYEINERSIYHFDLYRVHNPEELFVRGVQDYFKKDAVCLIEWPEKGERSLPKPDMTCLFSVKDSGREMRLDVRDESEYRGLIDALQ